MKTLVELLGAILLASLVLDCLEEDHPDHDPHEDDCEIVKQIVQNPHNVEIIVPTRLNMN